MCDRMPAQKIDMREWGMQKKRCGNLYLPFLHGNKYNLWANIYNHTLIKAKFIHTQLILNFFRVEDIIIYAKWVVF